ncbi:MAG: CHASE2 domain-containing protein [Deltaproteobacteria bacterium]|nr:CHASE2 domain-containing protein [Deltaproteobacteria bacterium]
MNAPTLRMVLRYTLSRRTLRARLTGPLHGLELVWIRIRHCLLYAAITLAMAFAQQTFLQSSLGQMTIEKELDLLFWARGPIAPPAHTTVVAIDDQTHNYLKIPVNQAFPRETLAAGLESLARLKPRRVVIDFGMKDRLEPQTDKRLARALSLSPTIIGHSTDRVLSFGPDGSKQFKHEWFYSDPLFQNAAAGSFPMKVRLDNGVVRRFRHDERFEQFMPSGAATVFDEPYTSHKLPTERDFINYYGPPGTIETVPFYVLLEKDGGVPEALIRDRVIFLGIRTNLTPGPNSKDVFTTSYIGTIMFGVDIHATIGSNIMDESWIKRSSPEREDFMLFTICAAGTLALLMARGVWLVAVLCGILGGVICSTIREFGKGLFVPSMTLLIVMPLAAGISLLLVQLKARAQKKYEIRLYGIEEAELRC